MNATVTKAVKRTGKSAHKTIVAGKRPTKPAVKASVVTLKKTVRTAFQTAATPLKKTMAKNAVPSPALTKAKAPSAASYRGAKTMPSAAKKNASRSEAGAAH